MKFKNQKKKGRDHVSETFHFVCFFFIYVYYLLVRAAKNYRIGEGAGGSMKVMIEYFP